uniref:PITH domain containing protein, putative n=1 Tax=Theileria annulata TaxID=5874 RepID=A0A3B0MKN9_THEAN
MHSANCDCKAEHELATTFVCLREYLDLPSIRVFNSTTDPNLGRIVFKPYDERLSPPEILSDPVETELLFTVPFSQPCDVHNFLAVNESEATLELKIFANRPDFDFSDVEATVPTLTLNLPPDFHGSFIHNLNSVKFKGVQDLALHFLSNKGPVKLRYIGLRGRPLQPVKGVVDVTYEVTPTADFNESLSEIKNFKIIE